MVRVGDIVLVRRPDNQRARKPAAAGNQNTNTPTNQESTRRAPANGQGGPIFDPNGGASVQRKSTHVLTSAPAQEPETFVGKVTMTVGERGTNGQPIIEAVVQNKRFGPADFAINDGMTMEARIIPNPATRQSQKQTFTCLLYTSPSPRDS